MEWKQTTTVHNDGKIELVLSPFSLGQIVEVVVREESHGEKSQAIQAPREPGSAKGRVHIHDDFDAPLPEFEPYL